MPKDHLSSHWNYTDYRSGGVYTFTHPGYMSGSKYSIYSFYSCPLTRVCRLARYLCLKEWFRLVKYEGSEAEVYAKPDKEQRASKIMGGLVEEATRRLEGRSEQGGVSDVVASSGGMRFL